MYQCSTDDFFFFFITMTSIDLLLCEDFSMISNEIIVLHYELGNILT